MNQDEEIKLKLGLHRLLTAITQGGALSDIQRMAAAIANQVEWPYASEETIIEDTGEEE